MAETSSHISVKTSTDATRHFVETYYSALNNHRQHLATYYASPITLPDGKTFPTIVWNGNDVPDASSLQKVFQEQMPSSRYEVQSYDCQVINPDYNPEGAQQGNARRIENMSILVTTSGYVKYGQAGHENARGFSETFVLVPNQSSEGRSERNFKRWLIQSQNFRLVV